MVPEVLQNAESIALGSPDEKGSMQLYVHLYRIEECREMVRDYQSYQIGANLEAQESRFLYLYYLFTAVSTSEIRFKALEEQNILGKVIQVLGTNHTLAVSDYSGKDLPPQYGVQVMMLNLSQEEISRIWSSLGQKQCLSLYYRVGPVEMEADDVRAIKRVTGMDTQFSGKEDKK
jgi:hypothetical protein